MPINEIAAKLLTPESVSTVVASAARYMDNQDILHLHCVYIRRLCGSTEAFAPFLSAGVLDMLCDAMAAQRACAQLQEVCLAAIWGLAFDKTHENIGSPMIFQRIFAAMAKHANLHVVQDAAFGALWHLSYHADNHAMIGSGTITA